MPVGDSITYGAGGTNAGYRGFLYDDLTATGGTFQFVGSTNGNSANLPTGPVNQTYHDGWPGWTTGDILGNSLSGFNNGASGNIGSWLTQLAAGGQSPTIITMMIGTNDPTNGGFTVSQGTSNLSAIVDTIYSKDPGVRLLVAQVTPRLDNGGANSWNNQYNADLVGLVAQKQAAGDNVALVDMNSNFPASTGLSSDGLHPNDLGYAWMASQWTNAILASNPAVGSVAAAIPSTSPVTVALGATLDLAGNAATIGPLSGAGNVTLGNGGALTVSLTAGANSARFRRHFRFGQRRRDGAGNAHPQRHEHIHRRDDGQWRHAGDRRPDCALSGAGLVTIAAGGRLVSGSGAGIGALLAASSPISSGEVALSAAAVPATLGGPESGYENMATLGGAAPLSQGGGGRRRRRHCRGRAGVGNDCPTGGWDSDARRCPHAQAPVSAERRAARPFPFPLAAVAACPLSWPWPVCLDNSSSTDCWASCLQAAAAAGD